MRGIPHLPRTGSPGPLGLSPALDHSEVSFRPSPTAAPTTVSTAQMVIVEIRRSGEYSRRKKHGAGPKRQGASTMTAGNMF